MQMTLGTTLINPVGSRRGGTAVRLPDPLHTLLPKNMVLSSEKKTRKFFLRFFSSRSLSIDSGCFPKKSISNKK